MSNTFWDANSPAGSGSIWTSETGLHNRLRESAETVTQNIILPPTGPDRNRLVFHQDIFERISNTDDFSFEHVDMGELEITNAATGNAVTASANMSFETPDMDAIREMLEQAEMERNEQDEILKEFLFDYSFVRPQELKIEFPEADIERPHWKVVWNHWVNNLPIDKRSMFASLEEEVKNFEDEAVNKEVHDIIKEKLIF